MSELRQLAEAVGLQVDWEDAAGEAKSVSDAALLRVLEALGYPAATPRELAESMARKLENEAIVFVSADSGRPITLPEGIGAGSAEIHLEGGETVSREIGPDGTLAPIEPPGYHQLRIAGREITLAIAPAHCFGVADIAPGRRLWGAAVQLPSLRGATPGAFGDFVTLSETVRAFAARGADVLAISPVHALFPADATRYSPYGPSSREFLNILFADTAGSASDDGGDLIDWGSAIPAKIAALRAAYASRDAATDQAFSEWRARQGSELERQATFDALHAHFLADGAGSWHDWPEPFRDPRSAAVERFAEEHGEEIAFYAFAQWRAACDLDAAQAEARAAGMAVGLVADLAVGLDPGGSQAWSRGEELLHGLSIGAPPDLLGPQGQNWGLTSFSPAGLQRSGFAGFIAMVRAALRHAGGLRIDHVLGLNRLWVIPHDASSAEGAYLRYPLDDMLRILAIESHRARAVIVGEDLGTVPPDLRPKLRAREVLGMRVLWFEREEDGDYIPPAHWDRGAAAMTGTHDLFTVAGWWTGRDIDWNRKLGRSPAGLSEAQERSQRDAERDQLWEALAAAGSANGPRPPIDAPRAVVDAATRHVAATPCEIAIIPIEDVAGLLEQPNLPGTTDGHPNWRRRMPCPTEDLLDRSEISARLASIREERR